VLKTEINGSGLEYLKPEFQTILKVILEFRIHQTTENNIQSIWSNVIKREDTAWSQEFDCKEIFRGELQLG
jgi:hypothetical protein